MIVFEDGIEALVNQIPEISNFKPHFHWGDETELNRYLALTEMPYPIVWLEAGKEKQDTKGLGKVTRDCKFILATREENSDQLNNYRLRNSYDKFLNPLADRLIEGIKKFSITSLNSREYTLRKYPNYSKAGESVTIDLWDAITIECSVQMNTNCQKIIKWQKK